MKTYTYFLILFLLDTSINLTSAQTSELLIPQIKFESTFTTRDSRTNQPLKPIEGFTLKKVVTAIAQRTNTTEITVRSDINHRVRLLRIQLENAENQTISLASYCVKTSDDDPSFYAIPLFDLASKTSHSNEEITSFTTADISKILLTQSRNFTPELNAQLSNILSCTTSGRLQFISQRQIKKLAEQARENNAFLPKEYPDLDARALEDIQRELEQPRKPQPVIPTPKKLPTAKPSNCF
jgi:hypothetical protein